MVDTFVEHSNGGASLLSDELGLFIPQACLNQLMNPADFYSCKISSKLIVTCIYNQVENAKRLLLVELQGIGVKVCARGHFCGSYEFFVKNPDFLRFFFDTDGFKHRVYPLFNRRF